ncbi:MAG TPA: methyltransferase [Thermoprotei archaeon]|nr:MAG: methyltransferase [Thermoprotei archaeon]HDI75399.1 methyltransferase [Thermoprotei archaeon]
MKLYLFRPKVEYLILDGATLSAIASKAIKTVHCNLGISKCKINYRGNTATIGDCVLDLTVLRTMKLDEKSVFAISRAGEVIKLAFFSGEHYYKLRAVSPQTAPTLEIDGIHMHRIKDITPWRDAFLKIRALRIRPGSRVLDVCTGLGYTAIHALRRRAREVVTVEKDENVLKLAEFNPWSWKLSDHRITIIHGRAETAVKSLRPGSFDYIIHDPPRIGLAGELYSLEFYRDLFMLLKRGGRLFHYTGQPFEKVGYKVVGGIKARLKKAGFYRIVYLDNIRGFIAYK